MGHDEMLDLIKEKLTKAVRNNEETVLFREEVDLGNLGGRVVSAKMRINKIGEALVTIIPIQPIHEIYISVIAHCEDDE